MITIRTGGNGAYKSAYAAYFTILPALESGRVVITNFEGMQPLNVIEERLGKKFPSTAKLIRIFSRDEDGIKLWQHFFCWCPLNALIVIDECQDIFSKNIGFEMKKIKGAPLADFLHLLPKDYENFFNSRYVPVNLDDLKECEVDDRGVAEFDDNGRIIYPLSFNEGFMRHRKYTWDIELLSPDWTQIDSSIKACAEQAFFHKNRDGFMFAKRKPYVYKHDVSVSKPKLPSKKDPNLLTIKIPIEAHLLYKSTGTGIVTKSGGMNVLYKNPMVWFYFLLAIFCVGYFIHGASSFFYNDDSKDSENETKTEIVLPSESIEYKDIQNPTVDNDLSSGRDSDSLSRQAGHAYVPITQVLYFNGLVDAYLTGVHKKLINNFEGSGRFKVETSVLIDVHTINGVYSVNENYLSAVGVEFNILDDCLIELSNESVGLKSIVTCGALGTTLSGDISSDDVPGQKDLAFERSDTMKSNSLFL